ncbi:MAG TPA: RNA polymerase-associated protein RapA [Saprospiraceae bacterium]|nr:RNA polymerase-associated protein RapA [Saprospiraceae bacterium]
MSNFFPDQRWTSGGEPELGVGIVVEVGQGRVKIHFPASDENRLYSIENAPLKRVIFKAGDTIVDDKQEPLIIERVEEKGHLYQYIGQQRTISEANLGLVTVQHGVDDRLFRGEVDLPQMFALRRQTLEFNHHRRISPVNGFVGGRIDLIPHQLYIAHEVSSRYAPRVLLSDQVGLGKTIEACLILHRLILNRRISRVLILVPESLIHQWFVEMYRRFNLWFHIYDENRCAALESTAPDGNPFLDDQLIICSIDFLAGSEKRSQQALSAEWDMLVVDEAHHLEWSVDQVSPEYNLVDSLSKIAKGLLLLTATPEQLGSESHFARLRLLDPERYAEYETFKNESADNKEIANIVEDLSLGKDLNAKQTKLLTTIFGKPRVDQLLKGSVAEKDHLIEDLLDQHGPGRVIFRNTRMAMKGFPKRLPHLYPIEIHEHTDVWIKRLADEFSVDMKTSMAPQKFWFKNDPRVDWLVDLMRRLGEAKVLLICSNKEKVLALEKAIEDKLKIKCGVFHEDLTIVQRDRNAAWFSEPDGARLLICSEIGSEGRNFQFAHHLVLFDLPFHPELLEQRIGRLDRIGQSKDIHIHVPFLIGSPQEILVRWFQEGLNAFEENLEDGNEISHRFSEDLRALCLNYHETDSHNKLNLLISETANFHQSLKQKLAEGRDRLLEMNSFRPKIAAKLVAQIQAEDVDKNPEIFMTKVFTHFGVDMEDLAPRSYLLHRPMTDNGAFQSIVDGGMAITFDRKRALSREEVSFLSWDHPFVSAAIDRALRSGLGGASFGVFRGGGSPALLLEVMFVLETAGSQNVYVDRFMPNTPIRVVVDHSGKDVTTLYPTETFDQKVTSGQIDDLLDNEMMIETVLPNMILAANKLAETYGNALISDGLKKMNMTLDHEINRLKMLQKKNKNIRPAEIELALEEQKKLEVMIRDAQVRMDAVMLVRKGEF